MYLTISFRLQVRDQFLFVLYSSLINFLQYYFEIHKIHVNFLKDIFQVKFFCYGTENLYFTLSFTVGDGEFNKRHFLFISKTFNAIKG